ncbi:MAG TPA: hypothetical protein VN716_09690 [Vicinamibacterales bacterium]|nr:hypothetical protein [Vicinamibacterales bacterium]
MIDLTIVFAFLLAIAAGQVPAAAQPPQQPPVAQPPGTPAAPPAAVPSSRKFTTDAGLMFSVIKPDKTADFEMVMAKVKDALGKSQDPKRKQQALSWRVFKGQETAPGGGIVYVWFIDPPVKDADYTVTDILTEAFPNEAQDLWAKYTACFVSGQTMLNLAATLNMSPTAGPIK